VSDEIVVRIVGENEQRPLPARVRARKRMTWRAVERALESRTQPNAGGSMRLGRARAAAMLSAAAVALAALVALPLGERSPERTSSPQASTIEFVAGPLARVELELLDDQELVDELAAAGYDRGVIRVGNEVWIVSR